MSLCVTRMDEGLLAVGSAGSVKTRWQRRSERKLVGVSISKGPLLWRSSSKIPVIEASGIAWR